MQLTIDIKEGAIDKVLDILSKLKDDIQIVGYEKDIEIISKDEEDYRLIEEARIRRKNGEKSYSIDELLKEFE